MSARTRLAMALVAAVTASLAGASTAHAVEKPRLDSVSIDRTSVTAPGEAMLGYVATSEPPITAVVAGYTDPSGRAYSITMSLSAARAGWGTLALPDGVRNGTWKLQYINLTNSAGTTYACRNGRTTPSCTEFRDFSAYDVTVSGSLEDESAPIVSSVTTPEPVTPVGQTATVAFEATDAGALARVSMFFRNKAPEARGHTISVATTSTAQLSAGQLPVTIPLDAYNGSYTLEAITAVDSLGNSAAYLPGGSVTRGGGATQPTSHQLDFTSVVLRVSGSTRDVAPPTLTSVSIDKHAVRVDEPALLAYATADASGLSSAEFGYVDANGAPFSAYATPDSTGAGTVAVRTYRPGAFALSTVALMDYHGNRVLLHRDGTWTDVVTGATGTHQLDFSAADVTVTPEAVNAQAWSHPTSVELSFAQPYVGSAAAVTTYRIVVSPGGRVVEVQPAHVEGQSETTTVTGLTNGTTYSFAITGVAPSGAGATTTLTATPMMSPRVYAAGDLDRDGKNDVFAQLTKASTVRLYRGTNAPGFRSGIDVGSHAGSRTFAGGPVAGMYSLLDVDEGGNLSQYAFSSASTVNRVLGIGRGWNVRNLDGSSDFTGDKVADIVAVRWNGDAYLYPGVAYGGFRPGKRIATGWSSMQTVFAARDVTGNGTADLLAVDAAGALWVYPGTGRGTFNPRVKVGTGWGGLGALFAGHDLTGDGRVDLGAVTMDGTFRVYPGRGQARFGSGVAVSKGWAAYL